MQMLAVIPVRMAAARLPGKPLLDIGGRTVVEWVHRRTAASGVFDHVVVATPDRAIADEVESFGGEVVLTGDHHRTGTDRVAEVAGSRPEFEIVANVQGDQPFVDAHMLDALVRDYRDGERPDMTTIGAPLPAGGLDDVNTVKVVADRKSDALYFSRAPIPSGFTAEAPIDCVHHHLGLYAFTSTFLARYATMEPTPLERIERLEQLRALEHGATIRVATVSSGRLIEINTPDDLVLARAHVGDLRE